MFRCVKNLLYQRRGYIREKLLGCRAFAEKVNADKDIEEPSAQIVDDLNALKCVDIGVQILGFDADLGEVFAQIF